MPDQLHDDIEHVRPLIRRCLAEVKDLRDDFARDRWWRRVGKVMVVLAFLSSGFAVAILWTYDQHARCVRGNETRRDTRTAIAAALDQAYEEGDEVHGEERNRRVEAVEQVIEDAIPLRNC
jgi:hypothetical protein